MARYWAPWLEAAGISVPRDAEGQPTIDIEISPEFAYSREEFVERIAGKSLDATRGLSIAPDGTVTYGAEK